MKTMQEKKVEGANGGGALLLGLFLLVCAAGLFIKSVAYPQSGFGAVLAVLMGLAGIFALAGLYSVNPNEGVVLQLFGGYVGTGMTAGLRWFNPFYNKMRVSVRVRTFDSQRLKVNDSDGNPIEIGAVVVYRIFDTAQATFQVANATEFVQIQAEAAIRNIATHHPYDSHQGEVSLRTQPEKIADQLKEELQKHVHTAGIQIIDTKISHLAYAPEIAHAMLQRQQAGAIVAARQKIVEGAVGMVQMALEMLSREKIVTLDEERKAAMVSNLLVVLCGDRSAQPIVNTGTLYS